MLGDINTERGLNIARSNKTYCGPLMELLKGKQFETMKAAIEWLLQEDDQEVVK